MEKEEYAIVLDYLPYGYPVEGKTTPVAQAIGMKNLTLLHLVPRRGITLETNEKVYIGQGKRDKIYYILGRLPKEKLTENAKRQLEDFIKSVVTEREKEFVDFFNKADAINTRLHQIELLPGFGKKHMHDILEERDKKPFESFEDIKSRITNIPDPRRAIEKRIWEEVTQTERHHLFTR
jgi:putative nucleotide binding protein